MTEPAPTIDAPSASRRVPSGNGSRLSVHVPCDICGKDDVRPVGRGRRFEIPVRIVLCRQCGFVYQNPRMSEEDLADFYRHEYRKLYSESNDVPPASLIQDQLDRGKAVLAACDSRLAPHATVLDVGCGPGATLLPFREAGYEVLGFEPSRYGRWGASEYGLDIPSTVPWNQDSEPVEADLVLLSFVLEHVASPTQMLVEVQRVMREKALLYLAVPNLRRAWFPMGDYFHVAHLSYFTPETLRRVTEQAGFEVVSLDDDDPYAVTCIARHQPDAGASHANRKRPEAESVEDLVRYLRTYRARSYLIEAKQRLRAVAGHRTAALAKRLVGWTRRALPSGRGEGPGERG